jgi:predicted enzyme related to lactoylglutathione lyase
MFGRAVEEALGGSMKRPPNVPCAVWGYYVRVADLDGSITTAKELGGQLLAGPHPIPGGGRFAILTDPQGAVFQLIGYT